MGKEFSGKIAISAISILLIFSLTACTREGNKALLPNQNILTQQARNLTLQGTGPSAGQTGRALTGGSQIVGTGTNPAGTAAAGTGSNAALTNQQLSEDIKRTENVRSQLGSIDGVKDANVIVNGNKALVGYTTSGTDADAKAIKDSLTKRVKQLDNRIENVSISDSPDIIKQMNQYSNDINSNASLNDISNKFNQIVQSFK